jgi:hypothetical protein
MLIKYLKPNVFDVFLGKGFNQWSRVRRNHYGFAVIAGSKLPHSLLKAIAVQIN